MRVAIAAMAAVLSLCLFSCAEEDPEESDGGLPDGSVDNGEACAASDLAYQEDVSACTPAATDYRPRDNGSADDAWDACISDDGVYHQIEASVSSIARVEAYEAMGALLWDKAAPTPKDFVDARVLFEVDQGLGSRIARRFDPHYAAPADGASCEDEGVPAANPDYCVGPATLQPVIVDAFAAGASGEDLVVNAARIQAALQWFLYVSVVKEATTCADTPADCDSSWAYYSGGTTRDAPIGLAADIDAWAPETHDRAYDGALAVRCWRDLDQAVPAEDTDLQARAIDQVDEALLRGMAVLLRQDFLSVTCSTGNYQAAALAEIDILVPLFDRATRERDPAAADLLAAEAAKSAGEMDVEDVLKALDETYPCP